MKTATTPELFDPVEMEHHVSTLCQSHRYKNVKGYLCSDCLNMDYSQKMYSDTGSFRCSRTGEIHFPDDDACRKFRVFEGCKR